MTKSDKQNLKDLVASVILEVEVADDITGDQQAVLDKVGVIIFNRINDL